MNLQEQEVEYGVQTQYDLFDDAGNRQYYTLDEFMDHLKIAINNHYEFEVIQKEL